MTIKELRLSLGLSQPKFAKALGIGTSSVGGYETGRINPSAKLIAKIKEVYDVDLNGPAPEAKSAEAKPAKKAAKNPPKKPVPAKKPEKKAAAAEAKKAAPAKKPAAKKAAALIIQSPMGGNITPEEIIARVGDVDQIYVRVDENKAYWVKGEETGSVDLW